MVALNPPVCDFGWPAPVSISPAPTAAAIPSLRSPAPRIAGGLHVQSLPFVKAIIHRLIRDARDLAAQGVATVAIMSNDTVAYPDDAFPQMVRWAEELDFPFPYLYDETQAVARPTGPSAPDFFGFNADLRSPVPGASRCPGRDPSPSDTRRELFDAMSLVASTGWGPGEPDTVHRLLDRVAVWRMRIRPKSCPRSGRPRRGAGGNHAVLASGRAGAQVRRVRTSPPPISPPSIFCARLRDIADLPTIGEEMPEADQRAALAAGDEGLWCFDPVDGSTNFLVGLPYFAVSVALIRRGRAVLECHLRSHCRRNVHCHPWAVAPGSMGKRFHCEPRTAARKIGRVGGSETPTACPRRHPGQPAPIIPNAILAPAYWSGAIWLPGEPICSCTVANCSGTTPPAPCCCGKPVARLHPRR